jgi:hypothetical protein
MKMIVKIGSLSFEDGTFSRGDIVEVTPERFAQFSPTTVEAIPEGIVQVAVVPADKVEEVTEAVAVKRAVKVKR